MKVALLDKSGTTGNIIGEKGINELKKTDFIDGIVFTNYNNIDISIHYMKIFESLPYHRYKCITPNGPVYFKSLLYLKRYITNNIKKGV